MDFHLPRGRLFRPLVVGRHTLQVLVEVPAGRRVDVHARSHTRIHLLLNERGMKMPRIQRHQSDIRHAAVLLATGGLRRQKHPCRHDEPTGANERIHAVKGNANARPGGNV